MISAGFFAVVSEQDQPHALFVTNDHSSPLVMLSHETIETAFLPQHKGKPLFIKNGSYVVQALVAKGVSQSELKKAFASLQAWSARPQAKRSRIDDAGTCCRKFAAAAKRPVVPSPQRIGTIPPP